MFKNLLHSLLKLWNIYVGVLISTIIAWLFDYKSNNMDNTTSYLLMTFTICSLLTFIKSKIKDKSDEDLHTIEKITQQQPTIKIVNKTLGKQENVDIQDTIKQSKNLWRLIMEKIKKFFKWIWLYKEQILGLLGSLVYAGLTVYAYIFDKFGFILQYFPDTLGWEIAVKIVVGLFSILFIFLGIRNQVIWGGIGSIERANAYLKKLQEGVESNLSTEAREIINNAWKKLKSNVKLKEQKIKSLQSTLEKLTKEMSTTQELIKLGLKTDTDYAKLVEEGNKINSQITQKQSEIENDKSQIAKYEEVLNK